MDWLKASLRGLLFVEVPKRVSASCWIAFVCPVATIAYLRADGRSQVGVRAQLLSHGPLAAPTTQGAALFSHRCWQCLKSRICGTSESSVEFPMLGLNVGHQGRPRGDLWSRD